MLADQLLKGSGLALMANRVVVLVPWAAKAMVPPASKRGQFQSRIHVAQGAGRQDRARRHADKCVQHIPAVVHVGNLVGEKFDQVHDAGDGDDRRMGEDFKLGGSWISSVRPAMPNAATVA